MSTALFTAVSPTTGDLIETEFTGLQTLLTGTIVPAFFALVVIGLGIALGVKWLRRGTSKA